jgi:hypothetical protein
MRSGATFKKWQRELARMEKRREKEARRMQRRAQKISGEPRVTPGDDSNATPGAVSTPAGE